MTRSDAARSEDPVALLLTSKTDPAAPFGLFAPASFATGEPPESHASSLDEFDALLAAKTSLPPARDDLVMRHRLTEVLNEGVKRKLILVSAPAGFGKTSLLSQWSRCGTLRVAWLSLDADDNDPVRFWGCFVAALRKAWPGVGNQATKLLRSREHSTEQALEAFVKERVLPALIEDLTRLTKKTVLVLDEYNAISERSVQEGIACLLDNMPPQLCLALASRTIPPLPLAQMRGRGELAELRAVDLRLTTDEAATFLAKVMRLRLLREDVARLTEQVDAQIVGLQRLEARRRRSHALWARDRDDAA